MAIFRILVSVAIAASLVACSTSIPAHNGKMSGNTLRPLPQASIGAFQNRIKAQVATASSTLPYGIEETSFADLYSICNAQVYEPPNQTASCAEVGTKSLTALASAASATCDRNGQGRCTEGTYVNDTSLGQMGLTLLINIAPQQSDHYVAVPFLGTFDDEFDTMTIRSNTLSEGTPVTLQSTMTARTHAYCGNAYSTVQFNVLDNGGAIIANCVNGHISYSPASTAKFTWKAYVGETVTLVFAMAASDYVPDVNATDSALSSQFDVGLREIVTTDAITPVTPGLTLSFASGGSTF